MIKMRMFGEFAFALYFEVAPSIDSMNRDLNCHCLMWATGDKIDHSISENVPAADFIVVREWYEVLPFCSIRSVHHSVRSNYCAASFTP